MANLKESILAVVKIEKLKITTNPNFSPEQKTEALGELEKVINGDFMTLSTMVQESVEEHKAEEVKKFSRSTHGHCTPRVGSVLCLRRASATQRSRCGCLDGLVRVRGLPRPVRWNREWLSSMPPGSVLLTKNRRFHSAVAV